MRRRLATFFSLAGLAGCGATTGAPATPDALRAELPPAPSNAIAVPIGKAAKFHPGARRTTAPIGDLVCLPDDGPRHGAHLELFAAGRVIVVPKGIGTSRDCSYPVRTRDRTGVIEVRGHATLADFFAIWGQPLRRRGLVGFAGNVRTYVDGVRIRQDPRRIVLRRHTQIVLAVGQTVPIHASYRFAEGL